MTTLSRARLLATLTLVLIFALLAAPVSLAAGIDANAHLVTIYSSFPLTGPLASFGTDMANGTQMAIDDARGSIRGIGVRYVSLDDGGTSAPWDLTKEMANADAAVADPTGVAYLGPYFSKAAQTSIPILCEAGIVMVSPSASNDGLTKALPFTSPAEPGIYYPNGCARNFARVAMRESVTGGDGAALAARLGGHSAYVIRTGEPPALATEYGFVSEAASVGISVVADELVSSTVAPAGLGAAVAASGADTVFLAMFSDADPSAGAIVRDLRASAPDVRIVANADDTFQSFIAQAGAAANGVYATCWAVESADYSGAAATWYARYVSRFGPASTRYAIYAYEAARVVLSALSTLGASATRSSVRAAVMATHDYPGLLQTWSFDADGDTSATIASVWRVDAGAWTDIGTIAEP